MRIALIDDIPAILRDERAFDLRPALGRQAGDEPILVVIKEWPRLAPTIGTMELPEIPFDPARLRAPIGRPGKIVAAPVNYQAHIEEMGVSVTIADLGMFLKAPSSVTDPGQAIELPFIDRRTDQEAELAVVVGRRCRDVTVEDALEHVFGYTCLNDVTVRGDEDRSTRKSFDTFTPMGPWIVTSDELRDPSDVRIRCWVNGELRQDRSTTDLIFDVPTLIAFTSSIMTLEPGDVIATGTPDGVGPLADGDRVTIQIEGVGTLENPVSAAAARPWSAMMSRLTG